MWVAFAVQKLLTFFSAKNIRILYIESAKTVNEMTLNELVKLTTLWTTGPRFATAETESTVRQCMCTMYYQTTDVYYMILSGSQCVLKRVYDRSETKYHFLLQSTIVILKSKGLSEILRDIRTSTYQICRIEEKINRPTTFHKWMCKFTSEVRNILKILRDIRTSTYQICKIEEKINRPTTFHKWMCKFTSEVRNILKILWKRGEIAPYEQFLFSTIFCYLLLDFHVKQGPDFHFQISVYSR